jgi:GTP-binding protein
MVENYLTTRVNLRGMVWLLDIRREVSKEDLTLWDWLRTKQLTVIVVITKADKLSKNKRSKQAGSIAKSIGMKARELIQFSAISGEGKDEIWEALRQLLDGDQ